MPEGEDVPTFEELRNYKLTAELIERVEIRVKQRFSVMLLVIGVVSFFGFQGLAYIYISSQVDPQLEKMRDAISLLNAQASVTQARSLKLTETAESAMQEANIALDESRMQAAEVREATELSREQARAVQTALNALQVQTDEVRVQLDRLWNSAQTIEVRFAALIETDVEERDDVSAEQLLWLEREGDALDKLLAELDSDFDQLIERVVIILSSANSDFDLSEIDNIETLLSQEGVPKIFKDSYAQLLIRHEALIPRVDAWNSEASRLDVVAEPTEGE